MAAKHTPPGDDSFRTSLLRNLGGGAALVVLVAAVFFGVGQLTGPDSAPEVAGSADESDDEAPEDDADEAEESDEPDEPDETDDNGASDEAEEDAAEPDEADEGEDPDEADESDEAEETDDAEDADGGEESDGQAAESEDDEQEPEAEPEQQAARIAPGDITVQVLDGVGTDGGAAAQGVAGDLGDVGYQVIAQNPALAYGQTTVLWTSGNEDRARQVAADIGAAAVRQQPGNLSEQVDVHVVVGADRA